MAAEKPADGTKKTHTKSNKHNSAQIYQTNTQTDSANAKLPGNP